VIDCQIDCWFSLPYAAALYAVDQLTLAGADPVDAWDITAWYMSVMGAQTDVYTMLDIVWHDVTGENLIP